MRFQAFLCFSLLLSFLLVVSAQQCGRQARGAMCPNNLCCSQYGYCSNGIAYCGRGCQSQCDGLSKYIPESIFNKMVPNRQSSDCPSQGFYNYGDFLQAAMAFPRFASVGDDDTRKREIAAFFAHTSHETSGLQVSASPCEHRLVRGFCYLENPQRIECNPNYPCPNEYYGRGPFQLRGNEKYLRCGEAIGEDLINNPELLVTDAKISFKSAFWFWMTSQPDNNNPSFHEVITGEWKPTAEDVSKGWLPGFGLTTNLINGANECGSGLFRTEANIRLSTYVTYCRLLGTTPGDNLNCRHQKPIASELRATSKKATTHFWT